MASPTGPWCGSDYMVHLNKVTDAITEVRLSFINDVLAGKTQTTRNLVPLQMAVSLQFGTEFDGATWDGICDGRLRPGFKDVLTKGWESQFAAEPGGKYGRTAVPMNLAFLQALLENLGEKYPKAVA